MIYADQITPVILVGIMWPLSNIKIYKVGWNFKSSVTKNYNLGRIQAYDNFFKGISWEYLRVICNLEQWLACFRYV